ncbi:MAG: hypothetical protein IK062_03070 [Selenomonadaceae bacterium]|nr:hypothetical protein [Selenomonadaceae bacterium]
MRYIWQNYDAENNFYIEEKPLSPYLEVGNFKEKNIGVNPVPRFYKIFSPFYEVESEKDFRTIENCLIHYLAQLDLKSGVHLTSIYERKLDRDIRSNFFGSRANELYLSLTENERRIFLIYLQRHESAQGLKNFFFDAVLQFFPESKFYFHEWEEKFLFCVPQIQTEHNENLMELLIFCLLDMGVEYEIFWNCHFGIIGESATMKLDEVVIY